MLTMPFLLHDAQ